MPHLTISSREWGPAIWTAIHTVTFAYPEKPSEQHKQHAKNFLLSLTYLLPCEVCRKHFEDMLPSEDDSRWQAILASRTALSRFAYDLHDTVNKRIGKSTASFDDIVNKYCGTENTGDCPIYARCASTHLGTSFCEIRPAIQAIGLACVVIVVVAIVVLTVRRYAGIVKRCRAKCPRLTK
jgi:hypothetical protein